MPRQDRPLCEREVRVREDEVGIWLETLDWRTEEGVLRYVQLTEPQRLERIERFRRQAASWDVTIEFPVDGTRTDPESTRWKREYDRTKKRLRREADQAGWEHVREMLESEHRLRAMPTWLRESFEVLGLGPRATLAEARRQFRGLAKLHHPDRSGSTTMMARLNEAWTKVEQFFQGGG